MQHPAELKIHQYLSNIQSNDTVLSDEIIEQITNDVREALKKQFSKRDNTFRLRMSNIGRDYCKLWFDKNEPESAIPRSTNFLVIVLLSRPPDTQTPSFSFFISSIVISTLR